MDLTSEYAVLLQYPTFKLNRNIERYFGFASVGEALVWSWMMRQPSGKR
jgi:hypothetical protein